MKYTRKQLIKGMKIESEHSKSKKMQKRIAVAHLKENPNYYQKVKLGKNYKEYLISVRKKQ